LALLEAREELLEALALVKVLFYVSRHWAHNEEERPVLRLEAHKLNESFESHVSFLMDLTMHKQEVISKFKIIRQRFKLLKQVTILLIPFAQLIKYQ
jgi:hypothetical protein